MPLFDNAFHQLGKIEVGSVFDGANDFVPMLNSGGQKLVATPLANIPTPVCQYHTIAGVNVAPTVAVAPKDTQTIPIQAQGLSVFVGIGWIQTTGATPLSFDMDDTTQFLSLITGGTVSSTALQIVTNSRANWVAADPAITSYNAGVGYQNRSFFKSINAPSGAKGAQAVLILAPLPQLT